ncbi:MAG: nucleotidyltransferase domain-containing protein [Candidatus Aenigmarchaeota archaeon]|nr:nucleotidyltransferase domain-containing protein [Candidatus Aenigmarchaeota archaeon]
MERKKEDLDRLGVVRIGVFGSFAKKKQGPKSDVDVLVKFRKPKFGGYMDLKFLLEKEFKRKVDLVTEGSLKPELKDIRREVKYARL